MSVKQISVFLENKPGALSHMTKVLADSGIDMRAFSLAEASDFGIARIIVDDVYATTTVLRDAGFIHSVSKVLAVALSDTIPITIPDDPPEEILADDNGDLLTDEEGDILVV